MMFEHRRRGRGSIMPFAIVSTIFLFIGLVKATELLKAASIPIWAMVIGGAVLVLRGPLGARLLDSMANRDRDPELEQADPAMLQELDDLRTQMAELQERVDFAERLLAREREVRPLGGGDT